MSQGPQKAENKCEPKLSVDDIMTMLEYRNNVMDFCPEAKLILTMKLDDKMIKGIDFSVIHSTAEVLARKIHQFLYGKLECNKVLNVKGGEI